MLQQYNKFKVTYSIASKSWQLFVKVNGISNYEKIIKRACFCNAAGIINITVNWDENHIPSSTF